MRKYRRQILVLLCVLLAALVLTRLLIGNTYRAEIPWDSGTALPELRVDDPEVARVENPVLKDGRLVFDVVPLRRGEVTVQVLEQDGEEDHLFLSVSRTRLVYNPSNGGFTGDLAVMILITVFVLLISAMMLHGFLTAKGTALYAYSTMFYIGFFFFALLTGLTLLNITLRHTMHPELYSMMEVYRSLGSAAVTFLFWTFPLLLAFSAALAVSNIALLRHNRPRVQNALGLLISVFIVGGGVFGFWLNGRNFSGSLMEYRIHETVCNVYCAVFAYFECVLAGAVICGIRAARHRAPTGREAVIILGCWFREDGTLPPLIRGRVDRAIEYWRENREETGREAYFIPSGGQGMDEPIPEAEAMKAYLVGRGIPERLILTETESVSTYQNMLFSRRVLEKHGLSRCCVFSTTNYHVFRSGMWAVKAGLDAEGIGSQTKWWFWPNAFMRECVGLVANRWKQETVLLLCMIVFFALLSMTLVG